MFKKRRQRSKKYTLTSFGSVDEDRCPDSQEEDGVFPGSESEVDDEGFSGAPDPTWDSDYLDMLEKRATAGSEGREDRAEDAVSPGLSDTAGKGAQLFEQQRKRAAEHTRKAEDAQLQVLLQPEAQGPSQTQPSFDLQPVQASLQPSHVPEAHVSMSPPPVAPKPATAAVTLLTTPETSSPEISTSNVLNRTARPFTPGFIAVRAATAPVTFRPPVTKTSQRPSSTAVVLPPFSAPPSIPPQQSQSGPPPVLYPPSSIPTASGAPASFHTPAVSTSLEKTPPPMTAVRHAAAAQPVAPRTSVSGLADQRAPVDPPQVPAVQPPPPQPPPMFVSSVSVVPQSEAVAPNPVPGPAGRTGILLEARRRGGKPKPMFNVPDAAKKSPNPDLLSMVQKMDDRFVRQKPGQPVSDTFSDGGEEPRKEDSGMGRAPPPVAPKPKVLAEPPQFLQAGGKGAELFARRQTRMGMYVVDTPPETPHEQNVSWHSAAQLHHDVSPGPSVPSQWKLSPNVRAPPPIGYNPLMTPSIPTGPQRGPTKPDHGGRGGSQRDGIKAIDFMRRQPYQLNPAMFNYGGSATNVSGTPSHQRQQRSDYTMVGSSLASPKQIPIKTARVYEVKRFSTPTPMSAPTLAPKVIAPRSATTLGERLTHSEIVSPPPALMLQTAPAFNTTTLSPSPPKPAGLPTLPMFSSTSVPNPVPQPVPTAYTPASFSPGLQTAKQFQSAPELSLLVSLPPLKSNCIQAPKPRFVATKGGVQAHIWRPGAM